MKINYYFPVLNLCTSDIKQHARNILTISKWFENSPIAQSLQLTTALELAAAVYGFKSYAALKNEKALKPQNLKTFLTAYPEINDADLLFLTTAHDYLCSYKEVAKKIPVYAEPSSLLLLIIEQFKFGRERKLFENLATANALGMNVYHKRNTLDSLDVSTLQNCTSGGALHSYVSCNRIFNAANELIDIDWLIKLKNDDEWSELNLLNINRPILIEQPKYKNKDLAKALNAEKVISFEITSSLFDEVGLFTQENKPTYKILNSFSRNEPSESEGVYTEYAPHWKFKTNQKFIANGVVEIHDYVDIDITYITKAGIQTQVISSIQFYLALGMTENGFRIERRLVTEGNPLAGLVDLHHLIFNQTIKTLESHQYVLANIWASVGAQFSIEETKQAKLALIRSELENTFEEEWAEKYQNILFHLSDHFDEAFLNEVFKETKDLNPIVDQAAYNSAFYKALQNPVFVNAIAEIKKAFVQERAAALQAIKP